MKPQDERTFKQSGNKGVVAKRKRTLSLSVILFMGKLEISSKDIVGYLFDEPEINDKDLIFPIF